MKKRITGLFLILVMLCALVSVAQADKSILIGDSVYIKFPDTATLYSGSSSTTIQYTLNSALDVVTYSRSMITRPSNFSTAITNFKNKYYNVSSKTFSNSLYAYTGEDYSGKTVYALIYTPSYYNLLQFNNLEGYPNRTLYYSIINTLSRQTYTPDPDPVPSSSVTITMDDPSVTLTRTSSSLSPTKTIMCSPNPLAAAKYGSGLIWQSSDPEVASVEKTGTWSAKIIGHKAGKATISVTVDDSGRATAYCYVTVTDTLVTSLSLDSKSVTLTRTNSNPSPTKTLFSSVSPSNAINKDLIWSSSDESVVGVDQTGRISAAGVGTATVKVETTDGSGLSASCSVTVEDRLVTSLRLNKSTAELTIKSSDPNPTMFLDETVSPSDALNKEVIWESSDPSIATVDEKGLITALKEGNVQITCTAVDGSQKSASCKLTVKRLLTPYEKIQSFVKRCYELILNRSADAGGLKAWSDLLSNKEATAAQIIDGFVRSDEFTSRNLHPGACVDILYKTMLNREADAGGRYGWVDALNNGYTLQNIIDGFCGSDEFMNLCDEYGIEAGSVNAAAPADTSTPRGKIEAFVKRCYELILNRKADEGGLQGWSDALEARIAPAAQIIDGFIRSPEFINRGLGNGTAVDILYKTMLNREADAAGRAGWVDALSKGYTLQHIINGFCGSAEFTALCSDYGIEAGSVAVPGKVAAALEAAAQLEAKKLPDERIGNAVSADDAGITVVNGYEPAEVEAFVKHAYRAALGREADEAGLAGWTEQIVSGAAAPKAFLRTLLSSDEQIARKLNNEQFIEMLYRLYLNRGMDDAATERIAQLAAGGLDEVIKGFESSAEFRLVLNGFGL